MERNIGTITNTPYNMQYCKPQVQKKDEPITADNLIENQETKTGKKQIIAEEKIKQAQMMAQKKKDMSDESLIDQFVERHANDRKD